MKRAHILFVLLLSSVFALSMAAKEAWLPKSAGPPACFSGEPPRNSTCHNSGCHTDFAVNSGNATLLLDLGGAEGGYNLGQLYSVKVALTKPGIVRGGFQAIALQDNSDTISPGTFTLTQLMRTQRIDRNFPHVDTGCSIFSKVWIEHTDYGIDDPVMDTISWRFDWRAPMQDVGSITFYVSSLEANADLDPAGDYVYTLHKTIPSLSTAISAAPHAFPFRLFPQPAADQLRLDLGDKIPSPNDRMEIYDLAGRRILQSPLVTTISTSNLASGTYLLKVICEDRIWVGRFLRE